MKTPFIVENLLVTFALAEICNIKCKFCYHYEKLYDVTGENKFLKKENRRFMKFDDFKMFFDNLDVTVDELALSGYGEPTINPDFFRIMDYIVKNGKGRVKRIFLPTNGAELDKINADKLLDILELSDIDIQVLFSINASDKNTYIQVCGKDFFDRVIENAEYFILESHRRNLTQKVFSSVQMVIINENKHNVSDFTEYWRDFFIKNNLKHEIEKACICGETVVNKELPHSIAYVLAILGDQKNSSEVFENTMENSGINSLIEHNKETTRLNFNHMDIKDYTLRKPCSALWKSPIVTTDGDLCICTRDLLGEYSYGNIRDNSFSSVFFNDKANFYRESQIKGNFHVPDICFDCQGFEGVPVSNEKLNEYCNKFLNKSDYFFYINRIENNRLYDFEEITIENSENLQNLREFLKKDFICVKNKSEKSLEVDDLYSLNEESEVLFDNSMLPCAFITDNIVIDDNGVFSGCEKCKIDYIKEYKNIRKMLSGDFSGLSDKCINCFQKKLPQKESFYRDKEEIHKIWKEFYIEKEFFERNLPDFNNTDFDEEFKNSPASEFRESYKRFILKYDKDVEKLNILAREIMILKEPYLLILLVKAYLFNMNLSKAEQCMDILLNVYPAIFFEQVREIILALKDEKKINSDLFKEYKPENDIFDVYSLLERYGKIKDLWEEI